MQDDAKPAFSMFISRDPEACFIRDQTRAQTRSLRPIQRQHGSSVEDVS